MNKETFIKKIESMDYPQKLDKQYEGSCPCFWYDGKIDGKKISIHGRCWRVSENAQDLHISGELPKKDLKEIAEIIKSKLDAQEWYNPYTIIYD